MAGDVRDGLRGNRTELGRQWSALGIRVSDARRGKVMKFREEWVIAGALISLVVGIGTIIVLFLVIMQEPETVLFKSGSLISRIGTEAAVPLQDSNPANGAPAVQQGVC